MPDEEDDERSDEERLIALPLLGRALLDFAVLECKSMADAGTDDGLVMELMSTSGLQYDVRVS